MSRFRRPDTVYRLPYLSTTTNGHGREQHHRGEPVPVLAGFDPGGWSEPSDPTGQRIIHQPTLYVGYDQDAHPLDQWRCRGDLYEVDGDIARWRNPHTGATPGAVVKLKRVIG